MKKILLISSALFLTSHAFGETIPPNTFRLQNAYVHYTSMTKYENGVQQAECDMAAADLNKNGVKLDMIFSSSFYDSRISRWNPMSSGWSQSGRDILSAIADFSTMTPQVREQPNSKFLLSIEVIDYSQNPPKIIPVYGVGKKVVTGIDSEKAKRFLKTVESYCFNF